MKDFGAYFVPEGTSEVLTHYGPPNVARSRDGVVTLPAPVSGFRELRCNEKAQPGIQAFIDWIDKYGLWHCIRFLGPCYDSAVEGVPPGPGMHAHGAALTFNLPFNPHGSTPAKQMAPNIAKREEPGAIFFPSHPIVVEAKKRGFSWGGDNELFPQPAEFRLGVFP